MDDNSLVKTKYYGIYIMRTDHDFWIVDDNGNEKCFLHHPTEHDIDVFCETNKPLTHREFHRKQKGD